MISDAVFSDIYHMLTYDIFWMDTFVRPDNQACVIVDVTLNDTSVKTRFYLVHAEDKWSICSIESSDLKEMVVDMYNSIYGNVETIGGESAASISMDDINKGIANNVYTTKNQCEGEVFDAVDFSIVLPERWYGEIGTDNFGQGRSCVELKLGADEIITIIEANIWDYENEKQVFDVYNTIEEYLYHQVKEYCSFAGYGIQNITTGRVAGLHQEMYAITWQMVSGSDIEPHIDDYAAIYFEANGKIYCANVDAIHSGRFSSSTYTRLLEVIGTIEAK